MNRKLIAAAVSAAVVAPVASQADITVYGRVNNAIDINDLPDAADADSTTDISGVASRFGLKGSTDIGNGMTVHGRYEFFTSSDKEEEGVADIRIATAGLSGAFGRIDVGNQWSAYFNTFGTLVSPTYSLGYYLYSSVGGGPFRGSNTIKYSNSFGPLTAQLDIRLNDEASPEGSDVAEKIRGDGWGLGLSFAVSDNITIAAAYDNDDRADGSYDGFLGFTAEGAATPDDGAAEAATPIGPSVPATDPVLATDNAGNGILATIGSDYLNDDSDAIDVDDRGRDEERVGVAVKATFGNFWAAAGWQNYSTDDLTYTSATGSSYDPDDDPATISGAGMADVTTTAAAPLTIESPGADVDTMFLYVGGSLGEKTSWLVGYAQADDGNDGGAIGIDGANIVRTAKTDDSEQLTWGVYHNMGGGLRMYYEAASVDSENTGKDGARHLLGMRVDF